MTVALQAILALIQQILPLVGTTSGLVGTIVNVLTKWLPLIVTEISTLYEPVKAIIESLNGSGVVTPEEKTALKTLDAKMDAAFEASIEGLDPDAGNP